MRTPNRHPGLWSGLDKPTAAIVFFLMGIGILTAFAASPAVSPDADEWFYLRRQLVFAAVGIVILAVAGALSVKGVRRMAGLALLFSLILLALTPIIGVDVNGAQRWIRVGGFSVQASEILKPAFIVFIAWLFAEEDRGAPIPGRLAAFGLYGLCVVLLMIQPDFGQTVLITLVFGALLWAGGLAWTHTAVLAGAGVGGAAIAYAALPHIRARILDFLSPSAGPGARTQTDIAMDAIARGGLWGAGPGEGEIKDVLPEAHPDFVFSVAAEEVGLFALLAIIGLYALLFLRAWMLALRLADPFAQLATAGLALLFGLQALVNIAVNLDIAPPTGMTLPFISYGGSSMAALCFSAGLMLALTRKRPGAYLPPERRAPA